jgi:two-component system, cell cycle sensor histidine kinase and response regulator CckA
MSTMVQTGELWRPYHSPGRPAFFQPRVSPTDAVACQSIARLIWLAGFSHYQSQMQGIASTVHSEAVARPGAPSVLERLFNQTTSDVLWSGSAGDANLWVSASARRICGYTPEEIVGMPVNIWLGRAHPADAARIEEAYRLLVVTGAPFEVEYRWQRQDGAWIWLCGHAVMRPGADAPIVDAVFTDITTQKRLEDQVRQLQKIEAVGQFTGGIAHDFNNLLAVILANDTVLLDGLPEGDPRRADAEGIMDAANRAAELTKQLLAFTRQHIFEPRVIDFNAIVAGAERMLRRVVGEDVDLVMTLADGLGNIRADAGLLEQVLLNLVLNARDAMPEGGKLSIRTSSAPDGRARLTVSDTGCGMVPETKRRVFEPFFTTKACGKGTGLGLSTCDGIVKQAGGTISVDSEPGSGTVFEVLLPVVSADTNAAVPRPITIDNPAGTETILVIEDEPGVRSLVHRMLSRLGYHVVCARDGQEAFAILHSSDEPIDLVLCDVVMPDVAGPEIVTRVQARSPKTRALFMSGHTTHALVQNGSLLEGHAFIHKPFAPSALARKVREVLDA